MSKLVVKIRDDDKNFPCCPLYHEGYCHLPQTHYYLGNSLYMIECLGLINKRPPWCPLKEEKEAIPIDWIEEWGWKNGMSESMSLRVMIDDWEKENDNQERSI